MAQKESPLKTLKDVYFVYTSTSRPQKQLNKENKPPLSDNPLEFHAWEIKVLVTEKVFKSLKQAFKGAKNLPNAKDYTPEMVAGQFPDIPTPEEDMVLVKFSQGCLYGPKGNRKPARPVTQIGVKGRVQDRNGLEITPETALGNGTKGHLQFKPVENSFGLYLYPVAICVTELVEYAAAGGGFDEDAFGIEELDEVEEAEIAGTDADEDLFEDDDMPF